MGPYSKMLVIRSGAIGDFIFTLPALAALREARPEAHIELMGHLETLALAKGRYYADTVSSVDRAEAASLFSPEANVAPALAEKLSAFDLILAYLPDADGMLQRNLGSVCRGRIVTYSPVLPDDASTHVVDHLLTPVEKLGIDVSSRVPRLRFSARDRQQGEQWLTDRSADRARPLVAVHCGAGSAKKRWCAEGFARVVEALLDEAAVLLIAGPADAEATSEMLDLCARRDEVVRLSGPSLLAVAQALMCCDAFLGNDSGLTHVAAALGVPTVAIFGPTDPARWGPRGERVSILTAPGDDLQQLEAAPVEQALHSILASSRDGG